MSLNALNYIIQYISLKAAWYAGVDARYSILSQIWVECVLRHNKLVRDSRIGLIEGRSDAGNYIFYLSILSDECDMQIPANQPSQQIDMLDEFKLMNVY